MCIACPRISMDFFTTQAIQQYTQNRNSLQVVLHLLHTEFPFADEFACSAQARDGGNTKAEVIGGGRCSRHGLQVTAEMMQGCRGSSVAAAADGDVGGCDDAW